MYMRGIIVMLLACFVSTFLCFSTVLAQDEIKVENIEAGSGRPYVVGDGSIEVGTIYYIDRAYVVTTMPEALQGAAWIMTANDDKSSMGADFLKFDVSQPTVVWLAHDSRGEQEKGGTPPEWLSEDAGWEKHPDMILEVTDSNMGHFIFWSKTFQKGEVVLGGNTDPPAAGQGSNYLVLLTLGESEAVKPADRIATTWAGLKIQH